MSDEAVQQPFTTENPSTSLRTSTEEQQGEAVVEQTTAAEATDAEGAVEEIPADAEMDKSA